MNDLSKEKIHFYNLDIIRLLAAISVVVAHAFEGWKGYYGYPTWLQGSSLTEPNEGGTIISRFINNLNLGVDTFFLISGFLITYLLLTEKQEHSRINIGKFYIRRALRIFPLYYLSILIAPILIFLLKREHPDYLPNIFFLNNFWALKTETWDFPFAHLWSICIEEHFYLFWPWLIAFIPTKRLPTLFTLLILFSIAYRGYAYMVYPKAYYHLYLHTFSRIDVMVIGAFLAYIHFTKPIKLNIALPIRLSVYLLFIFLLFMEPNNNWELLFQAMVKKYFYIGVIAFELMNYLFNENALFNFKKKNFLHYLGKTSYGIYMFGNMLIPFILAIENKLVKTPLHNIFTFLALNVIITCIISIGSYELFEKFFLSFKKRFELVKTER
jgi:peptidoglycan/LPS O-acetylase OafA/YrhL